MGVKFFRVIRAWMVSTMRACEKPPEPRLAIVLLLFICVSACSPPEQNFGFQVKNILIHWENGRMKAECELQLVLSNEAKKALVHGVPLTLQLELILRESAGQNKIGDNISRYEIRYLPLSDHYQVSLPGAGNVKTFPRLRHALAELSNLEVTIDTGKLPGGEYELLARSTLDKQRMPPPMRLPVWLSSDWQHDSNWTSWPLEIRPQA
jgi:hypothetical protein